MNPLILQVMGTDVGIETLDADITAALLEDKESEKRQKQDGYTKTWGDVTQKRDTIHVQNTWKNTHTHMKIPRKCIERSSTKHVQIKNEQSHEQSCTREHKKFHSKTI